MTPNAFGELDCPGELPIPSVPMPTPLLSCTGPGVCHNMTRTVPPMVVADSPVTGEATNRMLTVESAGRMILPHPIVYGGMRSFASSSSSHDAVGLSISTAPICQPVPYRSMLPLAMVVVTSRVWIGGGLAVKVMD